MSGAMIRVAVVQAGACSFDCERTRDKIEELATDAGRGGAHLAVFPEAVVSGYPRGSAFGRVVGSRSHSSIVAAGSRRTYLGKRRKLMPTGAERLVWESGSVGEFLAGPDDEREVILTADLDLGDIVRAKV